MRRRIGLVAAAVAAAALSSCTPGDAAAPTPSVVDAAAPAGTTNAAEVKRCRDIASELGILVDGMTLDTGSAEHTAGGATNCSWKRAHDTVLRLGIGLAMGDPNALIEDENPLVRIDPAASNLGGVLMVGREGDTLAEVGTVSMILPEHGLLLSYAGPAEGMPGTATLADAAQALSDVNEGIPASP